MKLALKESVQYNINFKGGAVKASGLFGGISFLLLAMYYFGLTNLKDCSGGEIFLSMILPMLLLAAYIVLLAGMRLRITPVYGILGTAYCVFMIFRAVSYSSKLNIVLAILWYMLAAVVYLGTTVGYIPTRSLMAVALIGPAVIRLLFLDIKGYLLQKVFVGFLPEAAALCGLMAFGLLALCLQTEPTGNYGKPNADTEE